jgi:hypothetical protein
MVGRNFFMLFIRSFQAIKNHKVVKYNLIDELFQNLKIHSVPYQFKATIGIIHILHKAILNLNKWKIFRYIRSLNNWNRFFSFPSNVNKFLVRIVARIDIDFVSLIFSFIIYCFLSFKFSAALNSFGFIDIWTW